MQEITRRSFLELTSAPLVLSAAGASVPTLALAQSSGQLTGSPFLQGNFAPVDVETTAFNLPVVGSIPRELEGRFVRIGPNPIGEVNPETYNWFTGAGMVHGLRLRGGKAEWYRNRYIVSDAAAALLHRPPVPGPRFGGDNVNTHLMNIGGQAHALIEAGGIPFELSYELESVSRSNLGGTLERGFAAHPKIDGATGELHVLTYEFGIGFARYLVVDPHGHARTVADIPLPHMPMLHDVAFTATRLIILDLPVIYDKTAKGLPYAWNDNQPPRIGLLPRSGDLEGLRWIDAPSCYVFHVMNAYDAKDGIVMDVIKADRAFERVMRGPRHLPTLVRWHIHGSTGRLSESPLIEGNCEFPRFNDAYGGADYRYGYTVSYENGGFTNLNKHDVSTGRVETHLAGAGMASLEPVFVARDGASAEDDGYVMSYVYNAERKATDVVILNAQDFSGAPLATIGLPVRVPFGFHGSWLPDPT